LASKNIYPPSSRSIDIVEEENMNAIILQKVKIQKELSMEAGSISKYLALAKKTVDAAESR
jgi:hypothetical protein